MKFFEFGQYWDSATFIIILAVGVMLCLLNKKALCSNTKTIVVTRKHKMSINIYYFLIYIMLVFLYTFKDISYGADTDYYVKTFQAAISYNNMWNVDLEPLYKLFNYIVRHITDNYTVYFFFASIFIAAGYTFFIKQFWNNDCFLTFLVLASTQFFYDMNIMRSAMGGTFILFSFGALKNNKFKKALVLTIIGTFFQTTLIVNIPFIMMYWLIGRTRKINFAQSVFVLIIALIVTYIICLFARKYFFNTRYSYYMSGQDMTPTLLGNWSILLSGFLALYMLYFRKKNDFRENIAILAGIYSLVLIIPVIILGAYRLTMYYYLPRLLMWGYFFKSYIKDDYRNRKIKEAIVIVLVLFYALFIISRRSLSYGFAYRFVNLFE